MKYLKKAYVVYDIKIYDYIKLCEVNIYSINCKCFIIRNKGIISFFLTKQEIM